MPWRDHKLMAFVYISVFLLLFSCAMCMLPPWHGWLSWARWLMIGLSVAGAMSSALLFYVLVRWAPRD